MASSTRTSSPRRQSPKDGVAGLAVDTYGGTAYDPSENVRELVDASIVRLDDTAELRGLLADEKIKRLEASVVAQNDIVVLRAEHSKELHELERAHASALRKAEADRLDSIRQVDREDVNKTAAQVLQSVQTLAATAASTAETLRNQVATTAMQAQAQRSQDQAESNKRLSAVELALSEGKGKQTVTDPALERLAMNVERLVSAQSAGVAAAKVSDPAIEKALEKMGAAIEGLTAFQSNLSGKGQGAQALWAVLGALGGGLVALLGAWAAFK